MSRIVKPKGRPPFLLIEVEPPAKCELCGKVAELRPYGPGGKRICFRCMKLDEPGAMNRLARLMGIKPN